MPTASTDAPALDSGATRLRRAITGPALFLLILGDVLGAGVYALVGKIAMQVGGAVWVPLLVALGFALLTAGSMRSWSRSTRRRAARRFSPSVHSAARCSRFWSASPCWQPA